MKTNYSNSNSQKRTFSSTSWLWADNDIFAKIEALRANLEAKNTVAKEENSKFEKAESEIKAIQDKLIALTNKSANEKQSMATYIDHFGAFMKQNDREKAAKLLSDSKKAEELFNKKILNDEGEDISLLKLIKLQSTKEKVIHAAEDKVETLINKSVEKGILTKELDTPFQQSYLTARALRLKERKDFKDEEEKVYSESTSRLSPVDHVVEQMESTEPDYTTVDE